MLEYFKDLSKKHNIPLETILSIALNRYGIAIDDFEDNRIRFNISLLDSNVDNFFAVCVNTYDKTPFSLKGDKLYLENLPVGKISGIEKDTCLSTYFRNNKKAITFNSNSRSKCVGCKFCGTYSLTDEDVFDFSNEQKIITYFKSLLKQNNIKSMKDIESVTICTGCFSSEDELINHLLTVNEAFKKMDYKGDLNYIGSQLRDYDKIEMLTNNINDFGLYLTIEKFLDRDKFMKPEKASLTLDKAKQLLNYTSSLGIKSTFLYILGLENLETINEYFTYFRDSVNKFPIVQVFQNYTSNQELYRCEEAKDVEYYILARELIESIFKKKNLNPKLWECFRSLYYDNNKKGSDLQKCKKKIL